MTQDPNNRTEGNHSFQIIAGTTLWHCRTCSAVVTNPTKHAKWHRKIDEQDSFAHERLDRVYGQFDWPGITG